MEAEREEKRMMMKKKWMKMRKTKRRKKTIHDQRTAARICVPQRVTMTMTMTTAMAMMKMKMGRCRGCLDWRAPAVQNQRRTRHIAVTQTRYPPTHT